MSHFRAARSLRGRRLLGPFGRGLLFASVIGLWTVYSTLQAAWQGPEVAVSMEDVWHSRRLLNTTESGNDTEDAPCLIPAIEQFPPPLMHQTVRSHGGVIVHILVATYMFMGLALVCDDYFVPSLDRISDVLNMPPDVAGATFMAAGSSAPELATAVIGVFVAKDDIGVSGVIGSAVFNITLVIAVCALSAKQVFYLNWYSVVRDCTSYLICIAVLLGTIANELVSWPEATLFLVLYVLYCVAMAFNSRVEEWANKRLPVPESWKAAQAQGGVACDEANTSYKTMDPNMKKERSMEMGGMSGVPLTPPEEPHVVTEAHQEPEDPRVKPTDGGILALAKYYTLYPLYTLAMYTIPDCRKEKFAKCYVISFLLAICWISLYSYVMVWMITIIGFTLGIPDTVMGLTFIAAGVSVPDALAGVAVVREGHGDMAVSNAIGSNVFDILVCLGLPWFLDTAIVNPGKYVEVYSKGLVYSTLSLFSTVLFLIVASHMNNWRLDRKLGIILLIWYFAFMIMASLYELNVFGQFNPRECSSLY